jgi:hypothetical protein
MDAVVPVSMPPRGSAVLITGFSVFGRPLSGPVDRLGGRPGSVTHQMPKMASPTTAAIPKVA